MTILIRALLLGVVFIGGAAIAQYTESHQAPQGYQHFPGVDGSITSVGSDTLANLIAMWSEEFKTFYPHIRFQIQASGSSTAPPALTEGTATIGPMSRQLKSSEIVAFQREYGYEPTMLLVAMDAIAVFVERSNTLNALTLQQVDAVFSQTRYCGGPANIERWHQLGVSHLGERHSIQLFGRNSVSGTYGLFKSMALCDGDFRTNVNEQPGSSSVVQSVASTHGAIGYAAYGYKTVGVKALALGQSLESAVPLSEQTVQSGEYPFTRFLYIMVNKAPEQPLPTLEREFLRFILSQQGQTLVRQDGYFPISSQIRTQQLRLLSDDGNLLQSFSPKSER